MTDSLNGYEPHVLDYVPDKALIRAGRKVYDRKLRDASVYMCKRGGCIWYEILRGIGVPASSMPQDPSDLKVIRELINRDLIPPDVFTGRNREVLRDQIRELAQTNDDGTLHSHAEVIANLRHYRRQVPFPAELLELA